jgi:transcriptional regulator with XRE-family HTH domain
MVVARDAADLGVLLRKARRSRGLTRAEVAGMIGTTRQWVVDAEKGVPAVEAGLLLDAIHAVGLVVDVVPEPVDDSTAAAITHARAHGLLGAG